MTKTKTNKPEDYLFLVADYDEFKPSSYRGLYFLHIPNGEFRSGDFYKDITEAYAFRAKRYAHIRIGYSSSVEDYLNDRKDRKFMFDENGIIVKRTKAREAKAKAYFDSLEY